MVVAVARVQPLFEKATVHEGFPLFVLGDFPDIPEHVPPAC